MEGGRALLLSTVEMPFGSRLRWHARQAFRAVLLIGRVGVSMVTLAFGELLFDDDPSSSADRVPLRRRVMIDPSGSDLDRAGWRSIARLKVMVGSRLEGSLTASGREVVWQPDRRWERDGVRPAQLALDLVERVEVLRRPVGARAVARVRLRAGGTLWLVGQASALGPLAVSLGAARPSLWARLRDAAAADWHASDARRRPSPASSDGAVISVRTAQEVRWASKRGERVRAVLLAIAVTSLLVLVVDGIVGTHRATPVVIAAAVVVNVLYPAILRRLVRARLDEEPSA